MQLEGGKRDRGGRNTELTNCYIRRKVFIFTLGLDRQQIALYMYGNVNDTS